MGVCVVHDPPCVEHHPDVRGPPEVGHQRHVAELWICNDDGVLRQVYPQHLDPLDLGAGVVRKREALVCQKVPDE